MVNFRLRVLSFLIGKGLLSKQRADMLMSWKHSGFNVHRSRRVEADERDDLVRLAQYIIRNTFSVECVDNATNRPPKTPKSSMRAARHPTSWTYRNINRDASPRKNGASLSKIADRIIEPWLDDPFPDHDTEPACRELAEPACRELAEPVMRYANG